ncbi:hypothetical protein BSLG_003697 [Batrachochytrium salamandrivorans]|nr:hypothetical protein BSLG_003697 [Batrachochytrium salamandrivorans]
MGCGYSSINTADVLESKKSKRLTTAAIASGTLWRKKWLEFTDAMEQSQLTASHWAQEETNTLIKDCFKSLSIQSTELYILSRGFISSIESHLALLSDILSLQRELHASLKQREAARRNLVYQLRASQRHHRQLRPKSTGRVLPTPSISSDSCIPHQISRNSIYIHSTDGTRNIYQHVKSYDKITLAKHALHEIAMSVEAKSRRIQWTRTERVPRMAALMLAQYADMWKVYSHLFNNMTDTVHQHPEIALGKWADVFGDCTLLWESIHYYEQLHVSQLMTWWCPTYNDRDNHISNVKAQDDQIRKNSQQIPVEDGFELPGSISSTTFNKPSTVSTPIFLPWMKALCASTHSLEPLPETTTNDLKSECAITPGALSHITGRAPITPQALSAPAKKVGQALRQFTEIVSTIAHREASISEHIKAVDIANRTVHESKKQKEAEASVVVFKKSGGMRRFRQISNAVTTEHSDQTHSILALDIARHRLHHALDDNKTHREKHLADAQQKVWHDMTHAAIEFSKVYASLSYMLSDSTTTSDLQPLPTSSQPSTVIQRAGSVLSTSLHGSVSTSHHSSIRLDGVDKTDTSDRLGHTLPLDTHIDTQIQSSLWIPTMYASTARLSLEIPTVRVDAPSEDPGGAMNASPTSSKHVSFPLLVHTSNTREVIEGLKPSLIYGVSDAENTLFPLPKTPESREALGALGCLDTMAAGSVLPHTVVLSPDDIGELGSHTPPHGSDPRLLGITRPSDIRNRHAHVLDTQSNAMLGSPSATKRCSSRSNLFPRHQSLMTQITRSTAGSSSGKSSGISDHSILRLGKSCSIPTTPYSDSMAPSLSQKESRMGSPLTKPGSHDCDDGALIGKRRKSVSVLPTTAGTEKRELVRLSMTQSKKSTQLGASSCPSAARATSIHGGTVQGAGTDLDGSLMYFPIYAGHPLCSTSIHDHSMASSDQSYGALLSASAPCAPRIYKQNPIVQGSVTNLISHDGILGRTRTDHEQGTHEVGLNEPMNVVSTPESPSAVVPASKTSTSPTSHPCTLGLNLPPPPPYTPTVNPNQRRGRSELLQSRQASLPDGVSYGGISPSPPSTQPPSRTTPHRPRSEGSLIRPSCPHEATQDLSHGTRRESISPQNKSNTNNSLL